MNELPPGGDEGDPGDGDGGDEPAGQDPFAHLTLDEAFIRSASVNEPAAADRERAAADRARADREANLQRLLADRAAQQANQEDLRRRFAPGEWDHDLGELWNEPPRRPRTARRVVAIVVVLAVFGVYALSQFLSGRPAQVTMPPTTVAPVAAVEDASGNGGLATDGIDGPADPQVDVVRPENWPPLDVDSSPTPLGVPVPTPEGGGPHTFLTMQPDGVTPVSYDPCRRVHYVTRPGGPPEGDVLIREALGAVSLATGLVFIDDGATLEGPSDDRAPFQPDFYGQRWAPVLFTWSDPAESPRLGEIRPDDPQADPAAYAGSIAVGIRSDEGAPDPTMVYVTGSVTLDSDDLAETLVGPDGRARVRAVIAHEAAHLVGLGHVEDQGQLMFPTIQPSVTGFGPGDFEGLARLGRGACFPEI